MSKVSNQNYAMEVGEEIHFEIQINLRECEIGEALTDAGK